MSNRLVVALLLTLAGAAAACAGETPAAPAPELPLPLPIQTDASSRAVDRATGEPAKDFELTTFDGSVVRLSDLEGKVLVVNFWSTYCPPCSWQMPQFEEVWRDYRDKGVVFVGVALPNPFVPDAEEDARAYAEKKGVTYPVGLDATGQITTDYRVTYLPTSFLIDSRGNESRKFGLANEGALRIYLRGQVGGG